MSKNNVRFHCGCGFKCSNPLEAFLHVDATGHMMEAAGKIYPDPKKKGGKE